MTRGAEAFFFFFFSHTVGVETTVNVEDGTALVHPEVRGVGERASSARSGCRGNRFPAQSQVSLRSGRNMTISFAKPYGLLQLCN